MWFGGQAGMYSEDTCSRGPSGRLGDTVLCRSSLASGASCLSGTAESAGQAAFRVLLAGLSGGQEPRGAAYVPERVLAFGGLQPVDVEGPVQVVGLVLETLGHQIGALHGDRLVAQVHSRHRGAPCPFGGIPELGDGQASLVTVLELLGQFCDLGVDHVADPTVDV